MSTLNVNTVQSSTSNPPIFKNSGGDVAGTLARAWVNFNGVGTVAIRDSFNVSSITDNGTGDYTINFTTPMSNSNYSVVSNSQYDQTSATTGAAVWSCIARYPTAISTTGVRLITQYNNGILFDVTTLSAAIFSN